MLKILVVEDDAEKLRRVMLCLKEVPDCASDNIDNARDASAAKRLLRENQYDLLILDIALPTGPDALPSKEGGLNLLDEVVERSIYHRPREIIGLTGYSEILDRAAMRFAEDLWLVIQYDPASESWAEKLKRKVQHILITKRDNTALPDYSSHLCVVTALQSPELTAILKLPWSWKQYDQFRDGTIYHRGEFQRNGKSNEVIAASAARMGMTAAAVLATKMIAEFKPRYIAMAGILAGIRGRCNLGDIIAADPGWDYGSGKMQVKDGKPYFLPAPHQIGLNSFIRGKLALMAQDAVVLDEIRRGWQGESPQHVLNMHIGPVASGAAVVADPSIAEDVMQQHRKVIGIEMETYGVFAAADEACFPQPKAFSLKAACDFADSEKNDTYQAYAAYTSAMTIRYFAERFL
jgi:nucleoside phosphorylase